MENLAGALDSGVELLEASVTDDDAVAAAFERARPQVVFHLAAQIDVRRSVADPSFDLDVNVGAADQQPRSAKGVEEAASASCAIYGEGEGRDLPAHRERGPPARHLYGRQHAAEGYLDLYRRLHGLETTSLRLATFHGPRQDLHGEAGVVAIFCSALRDGRRPRVFGDGEQTRDYVYSADVADAFVTGG